MRVAIYNIFFIYLWQFKNY